jgi:hypothetical protein
MRLHAWSEQHSRDPKSLRAFALVKKAAMIHLAPLDSLGRGSSREGRPDEMIISGLTWFTVFVTALGIGCSSDGRGSGGSAGGGGSASGGGSSGTGDSGGTSGTSGTSGDAGYWGAECQKICAAKTPLMCAKDTPLQCVELCQSELTDATNVYPACNRVIGDLAICMGNEPSSSYECDPDAGAILKPGFCVVETTAVRTCE